MLNTRIIPSISAVLFGHVFARRSLYLRSMCSFCASKRRQTVDVALRSPTEFPLNQIDVLAFKFASLYRRIDVRPKIVMAVCFRSTMMYLLNSLAPFILLKHSRQCSVCATDIEIGSEHPSISKLKKPFLFPVLRAESAPVRSSLLPLTIWWKANVFTFLKNNFGVWNGRQL